MARRQTDIAILGCGSAGAAIAHELALRTSHKIAVLYNGDREGSSFNNQRWKHSGLLMPVEDLARELWAALSQWGPGPCLYSLEPE